MLRRSFLAFCVVVPIQAAVASSPAITVYRSESCGCCGAWVAYLRNNGFKVDARNVARGIAVPAMPIGSPGMPGPRKDPFDTLLFQADGTYVIFARH